MNKCKHMDKKCEYADRLGMCENLTATCRKNMIEKTELVQVVRCKDCKWWDEESTFCLNIEGVYGNETTSDWFCADGEVKHE